MRREFNRWPERLITRKNRMALLLMMEAPDNIIESEARLILTAAAEGKWRAFCRWLQCDLRELMDAASVCWRATRIRATRLVQKAQRFARHRRPW